MMRKVLRVISIVTALMAAMTLSCRAPKKVLTEADKQQVKDSILVELPDAPELIPLEASFEDKIRLRSYSVNRTNAKPGDTIALTLYFECIEPVGGDFKIFLHLDGAKQRKTYDHYAINGLYPTSNWKKGEIIKDELPIQLDKGFPAGPARLWLGFFDAKAWKEEKKNVRLKVNDAGKSRTDQQDRLLVTSFLIGDLEARTMAVTKTATAPTIDGSPDETMWANALKKGGDFYTTDGKAIPASEKVEVGMLWDDTNLYVAFKVKDKDLNSQYTSRDSTLWSGGKRGASDVVEFYFDPGADSKDYLELQVSPANVIFDARFEAHRKPAWKEAAKFNMKLDHKVSLDGTLNDGKADKGYSVEMAIPWTELPGLSGPPTPDKKFRINFYRLSNSGTWASAWAPVGNDFHDLTLAGTATFIK